MGEARRRGTFEERKAQAIAEGRVKKKRPKPESWWDYWKRIRGSREPSQATERG